MLPSLRYHHRTLPGGPVAGDVPDRYFHERFGDPGVFFVFPRYTLDLYPLPTYKGGWLAGKLAGFFWLGFLDTLTEQKW